MQRATSVEEYIDIKSEWAEELILLRNIFLKTELKECIKWGAPTYTIKDKNIVGLGAFKEYVGIWFFNGVLLSDPKKLLMNAQEGKTQSMRQMRFTSIKDIDEKTILDYLTEAIENQKQGKKVEKIKNPDPIETPSLLLEQFNKDFELSDMFKILTPYKQKEYITYLNEAKREATKIKRLDKIIPMIKAGVGLNDKYRNC